MASWDRKLLTAAEEGNIKEVEICIKNGASLECRDYYMIGRTPLILAAEGGHLEVVTFLVTHGSQLEATDPMEGRTPLMLAAGGGHLEVVTYLVTNGSQLEATDDVGQTPLMLAALRGHLEVVTFLVTQGSQLEAKSTREGWTPLMLAAEGGHLEVVTYLVTHGSQLEVTDWYGRTALHHAAEFGQIDVTKWLVGHGCSPGVKSKQGKTPYDFAKIESYDDEEEKRKKEEVMDFLKTVMSKTSPEVTPDTNLQEPAAPVVEDRIKDNADRIIQNIRTSQILDHMMTHLVISADDRRHIEHYPRQDDQNKALLDIVIKRREPAYSVFVDGLRNYGYADIANDLKCASEKMGLSTTSVPDENKGLPDRTVPLFKIRLQKNYSNIITSVKHDTIVDHLISCAVLTIGDCQKIHACPSQEQKNRQLMDTLLHGNENGFTEFLNAVRNDSAYTDLANRIASTEVTSTDRSNIQSCYNIDKRKYEHVHETTTLLPKKTKEN